jgi:uncharacterized membrane protein
MATPAVWMVTVVALLGVLTVLVLEETLRRRSANLRFQHDMWEAKHGRVVLTHARVPAPAHQPHHAHRRVA